MTTVAKPAAVPRQRSKAAWKSLPHFTGDLPGIAAQLRTAAAAQPDGDAVKAIILIEAIQDAELSAPMKARLTETVIAAVQLVRGWDAPLAVDEEPVAGLPVDTDPRPTEVPAPAETPAVEVTSPAAASVASVGTSSASEALDSSVEAEHRALALEATERGEPSEVAWRLVRARRDRPEGDCVEAIALIEAIHAATLPLSPAARNRRTQVVLAAVRIARGWTP